MTHNPDKPQLALNNQAHPLRIKMLICEKLSDRYAMYTNVQPSSELSSTVWRL